ncbi:MAG: hypothetical protein ACI9OJ_003676, partial [Myxococcota bacterium]
MGFLQRKLSTSPDMPDALQGSVFTSKLGE